MTVDVNVTEKAFVRGGNVTEKACSRGGNVSEEVNMTKKAIGSRGDNFNWRFWQRFLSAGR